MSDHIPFISGDEGVNLVNNQYGDSSVVRIPLEKAGKFIPSLAKAPAIWIDPCVDGMHDLTTRRERNGKPAKWYTFMSEFPNFEQLADPANHASPSKAMIKAFVNSLLDKCAEHNPGWVTVPQFPLIEGTERNKINKAIASAAADWRSNYGKKVSFILPVVVTNQKQANKKTVRNQKLAQITKCYEAAGADGVWIVDKSLADEDAAGTFRETRFPGLVGLHTEVNAELSPKIKIGGPYWGLNLVLWARGLVDFPAIGIGSGYQFFMSGGHAYQPTAKVMLPSLRRRVDVSPELAGWLDEAVAVLPAADPARAEFATIRSKLDLLSNPEVARNQVAVGYKEWFDLIDSWPAAIRARRLYMDFAEAYTLGKQLPDLPGGGSARRPESVVDRLMSCCL